MVDQCKQRRVLCHFIVISGSTCLDMLNVNCGTPHKQARTRSWNECRYYVSLDTFTYMLGRQLWHAVHDCDVITKNWCATFSHHHLQSVISSMASSPRTMGRASCTLDLKEKFQICGVAVDLPSLQHSLQKQQCGPLPKQVVWACCDLSSGVALIVWFTTNGMCVKNNTMQICGANKQ